MSVALTEVKLEGDLKALEYSADRAWELVRMWRASFERGVGVVDPHPMAEQVAFLQSQVVPNNRVVLVADGAEGPVAGFIAFSMEEVAQLYVHVDYLDAPTREDFEVFLSATDRLATERVFVHCAANYRVTSFMAIDAEMRPGWTLERAGQLARKLWDPNDTWTAFLRQRRAEYFGGA